MFWELVGGLCSLVYQVLVSQAFWRAGEQTSTHHPLLFARGATSRSPEMRDLNSRLRQEATRALAERLDELGLAFAS